MTGVLVTAGKGLLEGVEDYIDMFVKKFIDIYYLDNHIFCTTFVFKCFYYLFYCDLNTSSKEMDLS